jgi:hypothetical protein
MTRISLPASIPVCATALTFTLALACSPSNDRGPTRDGGPSTTPVEDGGTPTDGRVLPPRVDQGPLPDPTGCDTSAGADYDEDGFANPEDCNDCSAQINPGAFDEPGNGEDEDCSGADAVAMDCDTGLALTGSAEDAARAMGLCQFTTADADGWGVLNARYTLAAGSGSPDSMQHGVLPALGAATPIQGGALAALSSGVARAPDQTGYTSPCDTFGIEPSGILLPTYPDSTEDFPPGFPVSSSSCDGVVGGDVYNSVALELQIRVPTNALGFRFTSNFYTYEYPDFICSEFNDFFAVLRDNGGTWENIVFDLDGNAVSVNNSFLQVCSPGTHGGKTFECPLGRGLLANTGYDGSAMCGQGLFSSAQVGAATGWLQTTAAVEGGEILTLRFTIWDSGDPVLDSTALLDAFEWELDEIVNEEPETSPLI